MKMEKNKDATMNQKTRVDFVFSEEQLRELQQVSVYVGAPSVTELLQNYIEKGLRRDKEKMESARRASLERQRQIDEISSLSKTMCPHCQKELSIIETSPHSRWGGEYLGVCLNNECSYFVHSWEVMAKQGHYTGYRYYMDTHGGTGPLAVGPIEQHGLLDG
jgi:hypothetical protein